MLGIMPVRSRLPLRCYSCVLFFFEFMPILSFFFFFNDTATTEIYTLSLHDALPIYELAQCYNVLPQLDINNTIDHRPEGDEKWFLENEKTVTQFCRKLAAERPLKDIRDEYNYPKKKGIKDECSRLLEASTMKS